MTDSTPTTAATMAGMDDDVPSERPTCFRCGFPVCEDCWRDRAETVCHACDAEGRD